MVKFREMKYTRPDFEEMFLQMKALLKDMEEAATVEGFFVSANKLDNLERDFATQAVLASIRHTIDTRDKFYEQEHNAFDEQTPRFGEIGSECARICLKSPYRNAMDQRYGKYFLEKYALRLKTFKPEIIEDLVEENKLSTAYENLIASAQIEFDGKIYNLSGMGPFRQSTDRDVRRRANNATFGWLAQREQELDTYYDKLVKVRHRIAKKLGFDNFIPVAYARMGRTDWDWKDAKVYRDQIAQSVVPFTQKLYQEQAQRLGIENPKNYDYSLSFLSGNPKPMGGEEYLVEKASKMYRELSRETGEFFDVMTSQELMDLTSKPGKRGGGYMTFIPNYKVPFIFSNFNGTSGDVDVLTHEAGHAFQGYLQRNVRPSDMTQMTMEVAEIHSMSMEYFTHPWMKGFFGEDTEKYYYSHVTDSIKFLPYGASIDEFQEWVYLNPEVSPKQRRAKYREIEKKYLPHLDYDGLGYLENGGRWQMQMHVYAMPFYYLDYTIAQVCAFQYFVWDQKDHEAAWESYLNVCKCAGAIPFKELVKESGLQSPFEPGCIEAVLPTLEQYIDSLDKSKIK